jgi:DNA-binding Lrp family transcriptional regulator
MLVKDGRASGRDLAMATGISEANVSRRLARLFEERSVRVVGFVPPEYLGYHVQFALFLRARNDAESLAKRLAALPHFAMVVTSFGFCDVIAYGVAEHGPALVSLLDSHIYGQSDVTEVDVRAILEFAETARQPGAPGATGSPRPLDPTDRRIIREVQAEGRISFTDLAAAIGISPTSAADRFRRLVTDGIVRILGMPDPYRVGLMLTGYMHFMVDRPTSEVLRALERIPELSFLVMMSGEWAMACEIMVRDDAHFDEVRQRVMAIPGVRQTRVALHRRMHRMSFVFDPVTEAEPTEATPSGTPAHA